jgi:arylsulfate sulfotransferase
MGINIVLFLSAGAGTGRIIEALVFPVLIIAAIALGQPFYGVLLALGLLMLFIVCSLEDSAYTGLFRRKICAAFALLLALGLAALPADRLLFGAKITAWLSRRTHLLLLNLESQKKVEEKIRAGYSKGGYTLQNPLVVENPYGVAPLTALLMFATEKPAEITLGIAGDEPLNSVETLFPARTNHEIPVFGLYAGRDNQIRLQARFADGTTETNSISIKTGPLPSGFPVLEAQKTQPDKMQPGWTVLYALNDQYNAIVDSNGDVRWYSNFGSSVFNRLKNGHILLSVYGNGGNLLYETDLLGKAYRFYNIPHGGIHHGAIELPNGNLLVMANDGGKTVEDVMLEIDRETGNIAHKIDLKDIFPRPFQTTKPAGNDQRWNPNRRDWAHQNSVWYSERDRSIYISLRHQSMIMKLAYPSGAVLWILSGKEFLDDEWRKQYLLAPLSPDFYFQSAQHAVMELDDIDNDPDTVDIAFFDNNVGIARGFYPENTHYSEGRHLRINEKTRTVEEIWSYGRELGDIYFSRTRGDCNYDPQTGNYLITFANMPLVNSSPRSAVIEVHGNEQVFRLECFGALMYRAERISLY